MLLLALVLALPGCQAASKAKTDAEAGAGAVYAFTDWASGANPTKEGRTFFHGHTTAQREGLPMKNKIYINTSPGHCDVRYLRLIIGLKKPAGKDFTSPTLAGELRIDDQAPVPIQYFYVLASTERFIRIDTLDTLLDETVRAQLAQGTMIRLTVTVDKKTYTLPFTLRNYAEAMRSALDACQEATASLDAASPPGPTGSPRS